MMRLALTSPLVARPVPLPQAPRKACRPLGGDSRLIVRAETHKEKKDQNVVRGMPYTVVSDDAPSSAGPLAKFSTTREVMTGRLASLGMFCAICGEVITGKGPLSQLAIETGIDIGRLSMLLFGIIAFNFVTGLLPGSPTWSRSNQDDVNRRGRSAGADLTSKGGLGFPISPKNRFVNKVNDLLVQRTAMILFLVACLWDIRTGQGPLVSVGLLPGASPLAAAPWWLPLLTAPFLLAAIGIGDTEDGGISIE